MQFGKSNGRRGQSYGQQLAEIHANALPGTTRDEEEEEMLPTNGDLETGSIRGNFSERERQREQEEYADHLDEEDSEKLPNASRSRMEEKPAASSRSQVLVLAYL